MLASTLLSETKTFFIHCLAGICMDFNTCEQEIPVSRSFQKKITLHVFYLEESSSYKIE